MKLALLGTGLMGAPMARRLLAAGHVLSVWNRTAAKAQALAPAGARVAATPADAVAGADVTLAMLEHGEAVEQVLFGQGAAAALPRGSLLIDMGSIRPDQAQDHARRLQALGVDVLDAPVSGGTVGAEAGTLAIMAGGDAAVFARALPVFSALGRATLVGPSGSGQYAKLANQMIVGIGIAAIAEALLLARQGGADIAKVRDAIRGGFAESRLLEVHGQRMIERDFAKRGAIDVQLKDLRNALLAAQALGVQAPITALLAQCYARASAHGLGDLDQAAIFLDFEAGQPRA